MIQSSISLALEVQPCIKNELTFRNRRHHRLVRKRGSKLTVKRGTKRQISLHRGTTRVTSMSPNAKLTLSPVSQVLYLNATRARFPAEILAVQHLIYRRGGEFGIWRHRSHSCRPPVERNWRFVPGLTRLDRIQQSAKTVVDPLLSICSQRRFHLFTSVVMYAHIAQMLASDWSRAFVF